MTSPNDGDPIDRASLTASLVADQEPKTENINKTETQTKEIQANKRENDEGIVDPPPKKSLAFKLAFVGLASSCFVFHIDATALGIALPTIANELNGQSLESFWANLSYTLCGLAMQPVWASISNTFGRKPPLYVSMALFLIGSIVFATATNMNTIIAGRVLQGLGGGGIDILKEVIIADMTTLQERSKYLGLMAIPSAVGNILGPTVSALFSNYASWRWLGWINLPFLGIGIPLVFFFLKLRTVSLESNPVEKLKHLDWIGMFLFIVGITIFALPLSWAGSLFPWAAWQTLFPMLLGVAVLVAFAFYETKPEAPIAPHRIFNSKTANMTLISGFFHGMIMSSLLQYLPLLYQAVGFQTAIMSAVDLLPTSILSVVITVVSMMLVPLFGGYTRALQLSWAILTLGTGLLALFDVGSSSSMRLGLPILWGVGVSLLRLNILPMQASVKHVDDTGLAIGQFFMIRMFGGLVGLTVASTIFNSVFSKAVAASTIRLAGPLAPLQDAENAVAFIGRLRSLDVSSETIHRVSGVYLQCFQIIFYTMTGFAGLGLITSFFQDEIKLIDKNLGSQRFED